MFAIKTTMGFLSFFLILFSPAPNTQRTFWDAIEKRFEKAEWESQKCAKVQITVFVKRKLTIILSNNDGCYEMLLSSCPEQSQLRKPIIYQFKK